MAVAVTLSMAKTRVYVPVYESPPKVGPRYSPLSTFFRSAFWFGFNWSIFCNNCSLISFDFCRPFAWRSSIGWANFASFLCNLSASFAALSSDFPTPSGFVLSSGFPTPSGFVLSSGFPTSSGSCSSANVNSVKARGLKIKPKIITVIRKILENLLVMCI